MKKQKVLAILAVLAASSALELSGCGADQSADKESSAVGMASVVSQGDEKDAVSDVREQEASRPEESPVSVAEGTSQQEESPVSAAEGTSQPEEAADKAGTNVSQVQESPENVDTTETASQKEESADGGAGNQESCVMYTTVNLVLRAEAGKDADKLEVFPINTEITVLEKGEEWFRVQGSDQEGYVYGEYLTESKEEAAKAEAEAIAKKAAQEAAQKEAAKSSSKKKSSSKSSKKKKAKKKEVSRENFDDCDGSGHGYTEIHYSDGSVEIIEY